jgi:hypothetical protein
MLDTSYEVLNQNQAAISSRSTKAIIAKKPSLVEKEKNPWRMENPKIKPS